jgi:hypothetical protein
MSLSNELKKELAELPAIDWDTLLTTDSSPYGLTHAGYIPKPYARLLAEGLALAEKLFGPEIDLARGSVIRKLIEMSALEHARTYALIGGVVDDLTVPTAKGDALSRLGEELGLPRPFLNAYGNVKLKYTGTFSSAMPTLTLAAGLRMLTSGGHHVALSESVKFTEQRTEATVPVLAFHPGPEHNLDPASPSQKISRWNPVDPTLEPVLAAAEAIAPGTPPEDAVTIEHTTPLAGGDLRWPDDRYRQMLLRAPRSIWTVSAMQMAVSLVPGARQVKLIDLQGGLDIDQPIFGSFNFGERVFGTERDLASPYYFTVLVAPTPAAIWDGPDGLAALVAETLEDLRPIGVFPEIREAAEVNVGVRADLIVDGIPLPSGDRASVNSSPAAQALKRRVVHRIKGYIDNLGFGEAVSPAKISWAVMNETGISDVRNLRLTRYPVPATEIDFATPAPAGAVEELQCGAPLKTEGDQVAVYVDDIDDLTII